MLAHDIIIKWNLHFIKFTDDNSMRKKSPTISINKDSTPLFHIIKLVWQLQYTTVQKRNQWDNKKPPSKNGGFSYIRQTVSRAYGRYYSHRRYAVCNQRLENCEGVKKTVRWTVFSPNDKAMLWRPRLRGGIRKRHPLRMQWMPDNTFVGVVFLSLGEIRTLFCNVL